MCGISGYLTYTNKVKDYSVKNTLNLMKRRGPDNQSYFKHKKFNKEVGLLHSRLNIIDLNSRSNQPFYFDDFVLIFNGEIYNFIEIRRKLIKKNYAFNTASDTEVLLKSYIEWGEDCVNHFIGMWAFAIWDGKNKKLFISRDNFGEKPLYYTQNENGFYFGSEIKFVKSLCDSKFKIKNEKIKNFLFYGYKSIYKNNTTFYENIFLLENATNLTIDLDLKIKKKKYWKPKLNINKSITEQDAAEQTKNLLIKSMEYRMRSNVPVAFCLSGGIDSGYLFSIASKILDNRTNSFSIIDTDPRYNERKNIDLISSRTEDKNTKIYIKNKKKFFFERINEITRYQDSPISSISYYVHSYLSENISKKKFRVAISGTGADELFTGYYDHFLLQLGTIHNSEFYKKKLYEWKKFIKPLIRNKFGKQDDIYIKNPNDRTLVYDINFNLKPYIYGKKKNISEKKYCNELLRNRMMNELFHEVVPCILKEDDHNSMYYSIENRSPYLDKDLYNFVLTIPPEMLIANGYQKKILRDASKNILPDKIRLDRLKKGFNASISSIIDLKAKKNIDYIFNNKSLINEFVNLAKLKESINFSNIPNHHSKLIFNILTTEAFLKSN